MRLNVVQAQNFLTLFKCSDVVRMCLFLFKTLFSVVSRCPRSPLSCRTAASCVFALMTTLAYQFNRLLWKINVGKHEVCNSGRSRTLAFRCECDTYLGEETLY